MIKCTADGFKFSIAGSLDELTLGRFLDFLETETDIDGLAALAGVNPSDFFDLRAPDLSSILPSLKYLQEETDFESLDIPEVLYIDGKEIIPPKNLGEETTFGQQANIQNMIKQWSKEGRPITYISTARLFLSTYLFPIIKEEPYKTTEQAESIIPLIDQLSVTEALPLSAFFLSSWNGYMPSGRLKLEWVQEQKKTTLLNKQGNQSLMQKIMTFFHWRK